MQHGKFITILILFFSVGCGGGISISPPKNAASNLGTVVRVNGTTSLNIVGGVYYLYDTNTGTGPSLKYNGADTTAATFGGYLPIGAVRISTGYEIAFQIPNADSYTLWTTDMNGNYAMSLVGAVGGADPTLMANETVLQQDINHDGKIGL